MNYPKSIPADKFRPMFDTSTVDGKVAVYRRWIETGIKPWVKSKITSDNWDQGSADYWEWNEWDFNYPAEPKRTLVPWTKDTVPREAWIRNKNFLELEYQIIRLGDTDVRLGGDLNTLVSYKQLFVGYEHSLDGGKTWLSCETWKEEV